MIKSLAERLDREKNKQTTSVPLQEELLIIAKRYQALPTLDNRTEEEMLGYDDGY